jgi:hypothetical protein
MLLRLGLLQLHRIVTILGPGSIAVHPIVYGTPRPIGQWWLRALLVTVSPLLAVVESDIRLTRIWLLIRSGLLRGLLLVRSTLLIYALLAAIRISSTGKGTSIIGLR